MMDYSNNIHDFVDGTLDSQGEEQLFLALSSNQGLRNELKEFIEFEKAAKADTEAFVPSTDSTAAIFDRLNIATGAATATAVKTGFFSKFKFALLSSITSALVSGIIVYFLMLPEDDKVNFAAVEKQNTNSNSTEIITNNNPDNNINNAQNNPSANEPKADNIPVVKSKETDSKQEPKVVYKYIYVNKDEGKETAGNQNTSDANNGIAENEDDFDNNEEANEIHFVTREGIDNSNLYHNTDLLSGDDGLKPVRSFNSPITLSPNTEIGFFERNNISLEFKDAHYFANDPGIWLGRKDQPFLENHSFTVLYGLNDEFYLGLDLRQEFFFLDYYAYDEEQEYHYVNHNNYWAAGAVLRWKPNLFGTELIKPMAQAYTGINRLGPIARGLVGFEISPSYSYSLQVGLEGSALFYRPKDNIERATKLGLHYGLKFRL